MPTNKILRFPWEKALAPAAEDLQSIFWDAREFRMQELGRAIEQARKNPSDPLTGMAAFERWLDQTSLLMPINWQGASSLLSLGLVCASAGLFAAHWDTYKILDATVKNPQEICPVYVPALIRATHEAVENMQGGSPMEFSAFCSITRPVWDYINSPGSSLRNTTYGAEIPNQASALLELVPRQDKGKGSQFSAAAPRL